MNAEIQWAKKLLEKHGYIVARAAHPEWREAAVRVDDTYVAFLLTPEWSRFPNRLNYVNQGTFAWIKPKSFCEVLGIDRHTLTRKLKHKNCPHEIKQVRGPTGRLILLQPTQPLIDFLLAHS